jgi:hypothetical protein
MDKRTKHLSIKYAKNATKSAMNSAMATVSDFKKRSLSLVSGEEIKYDSSNVERQSADESLFTNDAAVTEEAEAEAEAVADELAATSVSLSSESVWPFKI